MDKKNFGISEEDFDQMIGMLRNNDSGFFEKVYLFQFEDSVRFLKRKYGANHPDAYDAVMETILVFRKRFIDGKIKYGNLRFLFTKMASQIYLKSRQSVITMTTDKIDIPASEDEIDQESLDLFRKAWEQIGSPCKELLTKNYFLNHKLTEIAEVTNQPAANVRKQKERCLQQLRQLILTLNK